MTLLASLVFGASAMRAQEAANPTIQGKGKAAKEKSQARAESQAKAEITARKMKEPFWKRLDEAFLEQLGTPANIPGTPPPARRIPPAPFDSPPFPASD